ncbi:MAG: hypothetical protein COV69_00450 [Parcubacteria group bacterium CG11_big_fil_rev_8_21_14_0_20_39_14]|nr:MAG: hypothetical protein COV69_00450 [Parcubacteria group bacterium CG11_big_fil_rev_8_21_14_0_20_39_14]
MIFLWFILFFLINYYLFIIYLRFSTSTFRLPPPDPLVKGRNAKLSSSSSLYQIMPHKPNHLEKMA